MRPRLGLALAAACAGGAALLAGCAAPELPPVALRPEPVPYADTLPIPEPGEQKENRVLRQFVVMGPLQLAEPFDPGEGEALNVTHDDDVVSSAWWERRVGYRALAPEALARGPTSAAGAPDTTGPLVVKSAKPNGVTPGFTVEDAKGDTYFLKFDPPGHPHLQSAPGVIGNRLMWGAGFHVPEDYLTRIDPSRLRVDPDATITDLYGERALTMDDVKSMLSRTSPPVDGRYLAFASRFVPGTPKGPFFFDGRRADDPNDHYEHQHRRELRALWVFASWINDTDMREGNTLDVYVEPGYLRHYLIDFGATLGSSSTRSKHRKDETERPVDLYRFVGRLATLGLYKQKWEDEQGEPPPDPMLGFLRGTDFSPESWKPAWTNPAFVDMTHADAYWAAKILAAFSDAQVRAAVSAGGLPAGHEQDTLAFLLETRRDKLIRYYFERVSTVEDPAVVRQGEGSLRLGFRDLGIERALWDAPGTVYVWSFSDPARHRSGSGATHASAGERALIDVTWSGPRGTPAAAAQGEPLARLVVQTRRPGLEPDPATIFLRWDGRGYRVAGITHGDPDH